MDSRSVAARAHPRTTGARARWPYAGPAQGRLLLASLGIGLGSFLPWVDTAVGSFTGMAGPGVWSLYAAVLGVAGALVRRHRLAAAHAAVAGAVAVALPVWQGLRLLSICTGGACLPAPGLLLVLLAGGVALAQVRRLWRVAPGEPGG